MWKAWCTWQKVRHNSLGLLASIKLCTTGFSYQVTSNSTRQWLLASIKAHDRIHLLDITREYLKCTTVVTHECLELVSYYSRVLKCTTEVARKHLQLESNHLRAVYFSCRTSPTRELSSKFLESWRIARVFCKLERELYHMNCWHINRFIGNLL